MKDGSPFALAALWETWRDPTTGEDIRTFTVLTCAPNAMMATIHDRMPAILYERDYRRWLGYEPDPRDLLVPFPADLMTMWPIGSKVGNPKNDTADILDPMQPEKPRPPTNDRGQRPRPLRRPHLCHLRPLAELPGAELTLTHQRPYPLLSAGLAPGVEAVGGLM